jgi:hypothetical protein
VSQFEGISSSTLRAMLLALERWPLRLVAHRTRVDIATELYLRETRDRGELALCSARIPSRQ